jgi:CheY-like chemotaxis protein
MQSDRRERVKPKAFDQNQPIVLVVDDDAAICRVVSWALSLKRLVSKEVNDGQAAWEWVQHAKQEGVTPALIFLDLSLPKMDGLTFLRHVRTLWPQHPPPVVVMTAYPEAVDTAVLGGARLLAKPFHVQDLLTVVAQFGINQIRQKELHW